MVRAGERHENYCRAKHKAQARAAGHAEVKLDCALYTKLRFAIEARALCDIASLEASHDYRRSNQQSWRSYCFTSHPSTTITLLAIDLLSLFE
jgi:hypothetical protein